MVLDVFVINLPHRTDKKEHMLRQSEALGIPLTIMEAVNGNQLSDRQIQENVHDYPACSLSKGVIGCALSHIKVYKKMVDEGIPLALVLEDDALMGSNLKKVLEAIHALDRNEEAMVYLLSSHYYKPYGTPLVGKYSLHRYMDGSQAHGYVLNLKAAQSLSKHLLPVLWEADKWYYFEQLGYVKVYCVVPYVMSAQGAPAYSDLFKDRALTTKARRRYLGKLKRVIPWHEKVRKFIWKATRRPFIHKS